MEFHELRSAGDIVELVREVGFLPFFANGVRGFSIEEHCPPDLWFSEDAEGPWEWKGPAARSGECLYGKFFGGKAGFISLEWFGVGTQVSGIVYDVISPESICIFYVAAILLSALGIAATYTEVRRSLHMNKQINSIVHLPHNSSDVRISDLADQFQVSQRTIRNDLNEINVLLQQYELSKLTTESGGLIGTPAGFEQILPFVSAGDFYDAMLTALRLFFRQSVNIFEVSSLKTYAVEFL